MLFIQPNGLLGIFSTNTDSVIYYDMSVQQALSVLVNEKSHSKLSAHSVIERVLKLDEDKQKERTNGIFITIESVHGEQKKNESIDLTSTTTTRSLGELPVIESSDDFDFPVHTFGMCPEEQAEFIVKVLALSNGDYRLVDKTKVSPEVMSAAKSIWERTRELEETTHGYSAHEQAKIEFLTNYQGFSLLR